MAKAITFGEATDWLPIIYISAKGNSSWIISADEIEKLAYDLGGVAHVVVEPNREFSFALREITSAKIFTEARSVFLFPERG
nr:hypothetical protein [Marinicella sp. W31]MDC2877169.1 hypothetical protein [Marinicella sp. W31]